MAIVRIEQSYPLPAELLRAALAPYAADAELVWVQEEPRNMGAWPHFRIRFGTDLGGRGPLRAVSRPATASPATGSAASHKLEQQRLIEAAFAPLTAD